MIKSLLYKEWLKVKWSFMGLIMLNLLIILNVCISLYNDFKFYETNEIYGGVVSWKNLFYIDMMYIPLATGLLLGIVQFFPEMNANRLKLTLHLPMKESKSLSLMQWFGIGLLFCLFLFDAIVISVFTSIYFPAEIVNSFWIISLPWFLAGFTGYIFVSIIIIEPSWSRRILFGIIGAGFVSWYYDTFSPMGLYATFEKSFLIFVVITILITPAILFSGNNYKRGIR
mgnify:CR=1 FL=1